MSDRIIPGGSSPKDVRRPWERRSTVQSTSVQNRLLLTPMPRTELSPPFIRTAPLPFLVDPRGSVLLKDLGSLMGVLVLEVCQNVLFDFLKPDRLMGLTYCHHTLCAD
jgi:hypothetical protein